MNNKPLQIRAQRNHGWGTVDVAVFTEQWINGHSTGRDLMRPGVLEPYVQGDKFEPTFRLQDGEAQQFMDELWSQGVRPSNGAGSTGQLAATEKHLEDMRSMSTKLLNYALGEEPTP